MIKLIFSQDLKFQELANLMPLGMLSQTNLDRAKEVLSFIVNVIEKETDANHSTFSKLSHDFHHLIPQCSGDDPLSIINDQKIISEKQELLKKLQEIRTAEDNNIYVKSISAKLQSIDCKIAPFNPTSEEDHLIAEYCEMSLDCRFQIENIFIIARNGNEESFKPHEKFSNRMLLWHEMKVEDSATILKNGLKISQLPDDSKTGSQHCRGICFTDTLTLNRNENQQHALLLLCEVALGEILEITKDLGQNFSAENLPKGKHSVKAIGRSYPKGFKFTENGMKIHLGKSKTDETIDSEFEFNEFIIYDESRYKMKFLVQVHYNES